jgi:hypothetical protein
MPPDRFRRCTASLPAFESDTGSAFNLLWLLPIGFGRAVYLRFQSSGHERKCHSWS